ncbi:metal-dependent hydrolase [Luteimonas sp. 50]|uniref:Metal-dependent hydrolase n=1 Tax=Cognatiluteimonas sedimenti TaxID=2927791 RepID=A0ABT0A3F5_9GAMM|nr:metal-dependent hydrolase [Lysobacter sedimenti]MCJ0825473.1 metal-dependent hydrolase [Lysobacter sedimenti]
MDSITHLFLGGAIVAAIAPARHRRAALLAGAALNTLPDLDVFPLALCDNPIVRMTWHRSATHSWLVLPLLAWAIWAFFRSRGGRVAEAPVRWWWAIFACLMAHPLIDAFTIYGTQLFWPLPMRPIMWSSLFIVDPLFTLPWLLACVVAWWARERLLAQRALVAGIALGVAYVGWSLVAKAMVDQAATPVLAARGLGNAPWFSVPMPLTTQRWRVVAMTGDGYVEGERALDANGPMQLHRYPSDTAALESADGLPAVRRLRWFNHGFMSAQVHDGQLQLSDLRMGQAPDYAFRFAVAVRDGDGWRAIPPFDPNRQQLRKALRMLWRQWRDGGRVHAAFGNSATAPADSASK